MRNILKLILKIYIIINLCFINNFGYAENHQNTREQAYLIEKYLNNHKNNIVEYATKYKFINNSEIQNNLNKIDSLIGRLKSIQNNSTIENKSDISKIIKETKTINEKMKDLLNINKEKHDINLNNKKNTYQELGKTLSKKINDMYLVMYDIRKFEKENLSSEEKEIKNSLKALRILSKEVEFFGLKVYDTEEELDTSFLGAVNSIKYHINIIKKNVQ